MRLIFGIMLLISGLSMFGAGLPILGFIGLFLAYQMLAGGQK